MRTMVGEVRGGGGSSGGGGGGGGEAEMTVWGESVRGWKVEMRPWAQIIRGRGKNIQIHSTAQTCRGTRLPKQMLTQ